MTERTHQQAPTPDTMAIWSKVQKTDPAHTHQVNQRGGYTAIDPTYQLREATKLWGPYGSNWGLRNIEYDYGLIDRQLGLVLVHAEFHFPGGSFPISNAISPTMGKSGAADADFAKKLETNTLSKALSKLGFNADVFMGQFEDTEYLQHRQQEAALDKAVNRTEEEAKQQQAYETEMQTILKQMRESISESMLKGLFTSAVRKAQYRKDDKMMIQLTKIKDQRKAELEQMENAQ
ncbi:hypothetical protein [Thiomicrorhabdus cannonii]|uniref:hypothetical protein n=1 Tax=Thiomicrorhabdus cannonii TaxID=2748011 RepID=UPI0015BE5D03|nr:hypothetical protein [Thiomicrorhabdus cannonii]